MEKMVLKNKTEMEIMEGAALDAITVVADDWATLGTIAEALKESGNLDDVQFVTDEIVTGEYRNMKLESPLFYAVDIAEDGKIQKTEMELAIEQLQRQQAETNASQEIQDGAIMELAGMMGGN